MPSVSKKQQKFMGIVRAIQKGEADPSDFNKDAQDAAKKMKKTSVKKYAKTKHKGLPTKKVNEQSWHKDFKGYSDKELKVISKFIMLNDKGIDGVIKMSKKKAFKPMIKKMAQKGLHESLTPAEVKKERELFKKTGELPPRLQKVVDDYENERKAFHKKMKKKFKGNVKGDWVDVVVPGLEWMSKLGESAQRDYKAEYKKFQSSPKAKKYRAELNKYNRQKGTYGNGDGKDASHKGGKIVGFESQSKNRGRAEKSRLKKEFNDQFGSIIDETINGLSEVKIGRYDIGMGYKGNGLTIWNRNVEKAGDYKNIAHIDNNGKITNYEKRQPKEVTAFIKKTAQAMKDKPKGESVNEEKNFPKALVDKAVRIAKSMGGNMTGAVKKINSLRKGLSSDGKVAYALRQANESINEFKTIYNKNKAALKIRSLQRDKGAKVYKVDKQRTKYQGKNLIVYNLFTKNNNHSTNQNPYGLDMMKGAYLIPVEESVNEDSNLDHNQVMTKFISDAMKKAGIRIIKVDMTKKGRFGAPEGDEWYGAFFTVASSNMTDMPGHGKVKRSSAVLPIYVDKKGNLDLRVAPKKFIIGKYPNMNQVVKTLKAFKKSDLEESINENISDSQKFKIYNSLKKGDIVSIKYDSTIAKGSKFHPFLVTKGKTKLMKGKIERIIMVPAGGSKAKRYLYNRNGRISLALGDMAAVIVDMKRGEVKESIKEYGTPSLTTMEIRDIAKHTGAKEATIKRFLKKSTKLKPGHLTSFIHVAKKDGYKATNTSPSKKKQNASIVMKAINGDKSAEKQIQKTLTDKGLTKPYGVKEGSYEEKQILNQLKGGELSLQIRSSKGKTNFLKLTPEAAKKIAKIMKTMIPESINEARLDPRQLLQQLGGNKFIAMTGAKNLAVDKAKNTLHMKIGRNAKGVSHLRIKLTGADLYDMEFLQVRAGNVKVKSKVKGVYNDQLQKMFTKHTGMYTSL